MSFKCGILGLPNVGKSTLFNSISTGKAEAANFPFCTIEPNLGVVSVPDIRIKKLSELLNPQKTIFYKQNFKDTIPHLNMVLSTQFLTQITIYQQQYLIIKEDRES